LFAKYLAARGTTMNYVHVVLPRRAPSSFTNLTAALAHELWLERHSVVALTSNDPPKFIYKMIALS
jgi:hypothetical protein